MIRQFLTGHAEILDLSALCQRSIDALIDIINFKNEYKTKERKEIGVCALLL